MVTLSLGQAAEMPLSLCSKFLWPLLPAGHLRAVFSQRLPLLLQEHPVGTWLPEPGRAGVTLVMLWDGHQELPAAQEHNPTKASFSTPSLTDALSWSLDTSLTVLEFIQRGHIVLMSQPLHR